MDPRAYAHAETVEAWKNVAVAAVNAMRADGMFKCYEYTAIQAKEFLQQCESLQEPLILGKRSSVLRRKRQSNLPVVGAAA